MKELLFIGLMLWSFPFLEVTGQEYNFNSFVAVMEPPTAYLLGKYPSGNTFREQKIQLSFVSLEEYTSGQFVIDDSNVLQTYDNRNITWTVVVIDEPVLDHPTATRKGLAMIGHFPNGGNFSLELCEFDQDVTLELGTENISVPANVIKVSFSSYYFPFDSQTTHFGIRLSYGFLMPFDTLSISSSQTPDDKVWSHNITSNKLFVEATFQGWALVDNTLNMNVWDPFELNPTEEGLFLSQRYMWPKFQNSIIYDPDFRLLVLGDEATEPGVEQLAPWVYAAAIVPVAVVAVTTIAVVVVIAKRRRSQEVKNMRSKLAPNGFAPQVADEVSNKQQRWSAYRPQEMQKQ